MRSEPKYRSVRKENIPGDIALIRVWGYEMGDKVFFSTVLEEEDWLVTLESDDTTVPGFVFGGVIGDDLSEEDITLLKAEGLYKEKATQ